MLLERWDEKLAVTGVALVIAVGEPRRKFSQVALPDWLTAQRTERLRAGCPAIHHHEFHMSFPRFVSCTERVHWRISLFGAFSLFIGRRLVFHHSRERLGRPRSTA